MLDTYGRLELLGHRVLYGHLSEDEIAGVQFIAIDVTEGGEKGVERQYYSTAAVYCIAPMTEQAVIDATRPLARRIAQASYEDYYADRAQQSEPGDDDDSAFDDDENFG